MSQSVEYTTNYYTKYYTREFSDTPEKRRPFNRYDVIVLVFYKFYVFLRAVGRTPGLHSPAHGVAVVVTTRYYVYIIIYIYGKSHVIILRTLRRPYKSRCTHSEHTVVRTHAHALQRTVVFCLFLVTRADHDGDTRDRRLTDCRDLGRQTLCRASSARGRGGAGLVRSNRVENGPRAVVGLLPAGRREER